LNFYPNARLVGSKRRGVKSCIYSDSPLLGVRVATPLLISFLCTSALLHPVFAFSVVPVLIGNVSDVSPDTDLALVVPSRPVVVDMTSRPVSLVMAGGQYLIAVNATNNDEIRDWASVVIVEVRDSNGITLWLNWHSQTVSANSSYGLDMSWMPEHPGTYQIRSFVISSLSNPRIFSDVKETEVTVR
jgi:hypothetical protein